MMMMNSFDVIVRSGIGIGSEEIAESGRRPVRVE
jgi:hypothetical protein